MIRWPDERALASWTWNLTSMIFHLAVVNGVLVLLWGTGGQWELHRRLVGPHPVRAALLGLAVGAGLAATARMPPLAPMWSALVRRSSPPSLGGRVLVASTGAVAEEMLFRAVLLPLLGPLLSTVLFAASHVPSERALRIWPLVGLATGAVFAWLTLEQGGVLGAIVAHLCWELSGRTFTDATSTGSAT